MAKAFDLTVPSSTVTLDAQRAGRVSVTATSVLTRPVRARFKVLPDAPAEASWFQVSSNGSTGAGPAPATPVDTEHDFAAGATQQFVVNVTVPPTVPPGTYTASCLLEAEDNTDEDFDKLPIAVVAAAVEQKAKAFPWQIPVAILAVVLIAALALFGIKKLTADDPKQQVAVPDFVGQTVPAAANRAADANLILVVESRLTLGGDGSVIDQTPASGTMVEPASKVTVTIGTTFVIPIKEIELLQDRVKRQQQINDLVEELNQQKVPSK